MGTSFATFISQVSDRVYVRVFLKEMHLRKPMVLTPLRSLRTCVRNEVELVLLACEDERDAKKKTTKLND